jgi:hypothetical protein
MPEQASREGIEAMAVALAEPARREGVGPVASGGSGGAWSTERSRWLRPQSFYGVAAVTARDGRRIPMS